MKRRILRDFILLIVGGIIFSSITIYATYKYQASEVGYTPNNSNFDVDNVSDAIKELYKRVESSSTPTDILGNIEKSENFLPNDYFKSTADDNNVIFGGYCWKIIRKTDTDDIRLLYNGLPQDGECTKTGKDTQINTSKYSDDNTVTSYSESVVKRVVDNWYNNNLATNYSDKITTIDLITREEASNVNGGYLVSGEQYWTQSSSGENVTTTSSCQFSGSCSGTATGEIYSSGIYTINDIGELVNSNNGTYNGGLSSSCSYCTRWIYGCLGGGTSCEQRTANGCPCCSYSTYNGSCTATASGSSLAVRPVITLKSTVTLQGGNGTTSSPYYLN